MSVGRRAGNRMLDSDALAKKIQTCVTCVSGKLNADIVLFSGDIRSPADHELIDLVKEYQSKPNVFVFLTTDGGSADAAYRIARCLQQKYCKGRVILFVETYCKSAGTLVSLAADEIVMCDLAELGPLDVQISKPDELSELTSGLTPLQALNTLQTEAFKTFEESFLKLRFRSGLQITTRTAADIAARLAIGLFKPIYAQLDPMRLGEYQRAMLIAQHYGTRLARKNLRENALDRLIADYPSHGFIIDRIEAETLFHKVRGPSEEESELANLLSVLVQEGLKNDEATVEFLSAEERGDACELHTETTEPGEVSSPSRPDRDPALGDGRAKSFQVTHQEPDKATGKARNGKEEGQPG